MRARDIMTRHVVSVRPETPVTEAAAIAASLGVSALPVVDADDRLIGIVSESDMLRHRVPPDPRAPHWRRPDDEPSAAPGATVADVMTTAVNCMSEGADAADLTEVMLDRNVRSIPIVRGSTLVGIVSRRDLLRTMVRADERIGADVRGRLDQYAGGTAPWRVDVADGAVTVSGPFDDAAQERVVAILAGTVGGVSGVRVAETSAAEVPHEQTVAAGSR